MDPLSHIALGRMLAALPRRTGLAPGLTAAAIAGALAPDLDAVAMPFGWDRYLRVHEVGTHAVLGSLVCALLAAALVRLVVTAAPLARLWRYAAAGALSHLALDVLSGARIRLLWPLADAVVSLPIVAMADPILLGVLVGGLAALTVLRPVKRQAAMVAVAAVALGLTAKGAAGLAAVAHYEAAVGAAPAAARVVEARWGSLASWHVFDRSGDRLRVWLSDATAARPELLSEWAVAPETPIVERSRALSTVRNFLAVHELVFHAVFPAADQGQTLLWSDIRYCWNPDEPGAPQGEPVVVAPSGARLACGLWFGAEFDADGRPRREIVRVGTWTQARAPR